MAITIPTYTGEGAGVGMIREGGKQAAQALKEFNQTVLEAEKFKYGERKKEEASFLEAIKTKPEFIISDKARKIQADALLSFNNQFAPLIRKGYLTMEEKTRMASEKAALEALQQEQLSQYQQYLQMKEMVLKDTQNRLDPLKFQQWEQDYIKNGRFDHSELPLKGQSLSLFLQKNPAAGTEHIENNVRLSATLPEAEQYITDQVLSREDLRIGLVDEFKNLSPQDKLKYLDVDRSGTVSLKEARAAEGVNNNVNNPILRYAHERYAKTAIKEYPYKPTAPKGATAAEKAETLEVGIQTPALAKTFSDRQYSQTQSFEFRGKRVFNNIPTRGGKVLNADWSEEEIAKGVIDARLVLYDPTKRVFLMKSTATSESADQKSQTLFEIPEDNIIGFENIPIEYIGNKMTIAKYRTLMEEPAPIITQPTKKTLYTR